METQDDMATRIAQLKLRRLQELNNRLTNTLNQEREPASKACMSIIAYSNETPDYLIPYLWKLAPENNKYLQYQNMRSLRHYGKRENNAGCCTIV